MKDIRIFVASSKELLLERNRLSYLTPVEEAERRMGDFTQFADRCPWDKFGGRNWAWLLGAQPQFADRCPWEKLSREDWENLLEAQPQFADKCPFKGILDGKN